MLNSGKCASTQQRITQFPYFPSGLWFTSMTRLVTRAKTKFSTFQMSDPLGADLSPFWHTHTASAKHWTHTHTHARARAHMARHTHHMCMHTCAHVRTYVCTRGHTQTLTHMHVCDHTHIHNLLLTVCSTTITLILEDWNRQLTTAQYLR